jgi:2-oxoglutarate ferredoxin oxidoreductase subunit beta
MNDSKNRQRFNTAARPNWCSGCGNFGILSALKKALLQLDLEPHEVVMSTGIGCSSKIAHWINVYGVHCLHGRSLPIAAGIRLANHNLCVIAEGGDGDGYSEGMNHFMQACRRNVDFTYIVHNNGVFSLTTGQTSTTGRQGFVSGSTPEGSIEPPFSPVAMAIAAGASFAARGFSGDMEQLHDLIVAAVRHRGFAFIDVMQVCVSYNPAKSYKWYKDRVYRLKDEDHDAADKDRALALALAGGEDRLATGLFYEDDRPPYEDSLPQIARVPLVKQDIDKVDVRGLMKELI